MNCQTNVCGNYVMIFKNMFQHVMNTNESKQDWLWFIDVEIVLYLVNIPKKKQNVHRSILIDMNTLKNSQFDEIRAIL